jgi:tRNASer (uridine44-2'-O)-methyltransferase
MITKKNMTLIEMSELLSTIHELSVTSVLARWHIWSTIHDLNLLSLHVCIRSHQPPARSRILNYPIRRPTIMSPSPVDPDTVSAVSQKLAESKVTTSASSSDPSKFQPIDRTNTKPDIELSSDETWLTILETPCTFGANIFEEVMLNFIKNPNVTSSYLFRADILHDTESEQRGTGLDQINSPDTEGHKPRTFELPGWKQTRVIVRLLIPRNQQLDRPLVQTCILLSKEKKTKEDLEEHLVVYIPHTSSPEETPFYHPRVARLAFHHTFRPTMNNDSTTNNANDSIPGNGTLSLSYNPFQSSPEIDSKLQRTGLKLLQTIHKHGQGQLGGYKKRVHHDRLVPQKSYQDTYARLKAKYGRKLSEGWVEVTDPSKHVFEDLGIAAFCLELWRQMYRVPETAKGEQGDQATGGAEDPERQSEGGEVKPESGAGNNGDEKPAFPGFVDIGCGNGLLVYILLSEGYPGFGFDARERKTWETFPPEIRQHLRQSLLVPEILRPKTDSSEETSTTIDTASEDAAKSWHSGLFTPGTFIISNHADELTAWTPLLAYLNKSAFIAIPCCSHDLAGSRFRAPDSTKAQKAQQTAAKKREITEQQQRNEHAARLPQQEASSGGAGGEADPSAAHAHDLRLSQAAETGSLKRTLVHKKMASAYSTLCAYASALAEAVGFEAEEEILRIPSTRNASIVGRRRRCADESVDLDERRLKVVELVEEELGRTIENVGREWIERAEKLEKKPSSGH